MRLAVLLVGTSILAACGGGGGTGIGSVGNTPPPTAVTNANNHTFVAPTTEKIYKANGASHTFNYTVEVNNLANSTSGQQSQRYAGNATTVRQSGLSIAYNPRDAIFDITLSDPQANLTLTSRFQDPVHRTDFGGQLEPQIGTPNLSLPGLQYLQAASLGSSSSHYGFVGNTLRLALPSTPGNASATYSQDTFFYQKPGTTTRYVTFAGFLRNNLTANRVETAAVVATPTTPAVNATSTTTYTNNLARGVAVYGEQTLNGDVPRTGSGTYTGAMLATAIINDQLDNNAFAPSYFQWIQGTSTTSINFGNNTFTLNLNGNVLAPQLDGVNSSTSTIQTGATFNAEGRGAVDLVAAGGFLGQFQRVWFVNPDSSQLQLLIAGSSIDGAFYGPTAQEVGGSYRIVGGTPDERIDILGIFTGGRQ